MRIPKHSLFAIIAILLTTHSSIADVQKYVDDWLCELRFPAYDKPVQFECLIRKSDSGDLVPLIRNADELIPVQSFGVAGEKLHLYFKHYDSELILSGAGGRYVGEIYGEFRRNRGEQRKPVTAQMKGNLLREALNTFIVDDKDQDCNEFGRWHVKFADGDTAIAVIDKDRATFLTTTGDYRYMGRVKHIRPKMHRPYPVAPRTFAYSVFDGAHAFRFDARVEKVNGECKMVGKFFYAPDTIVDFTAVRDDDARLPDGFSLTKSTRESIAGLAFPDLDGKTQKLTELLNGHPGIIEIFGSWCPNCHDAAELMAEFDRTYRDKGLRSIGLAFEYADDHAEQAKRVRTYLKRHDIDFPILIAGTADKAKATEALDLLDRVRAYPTFLFIDRTGKIRAIYSGFSGPATGAEHEKLKAAFRKQVEQLLEK